MNETQIRLMQKEDLEEILRIQDECYSEIEPESLGCLLSKLKLSPDSCWVATDGERILAYLICHPWGIDSVPSLNVKLESLPDDATTFYFHDLAVGSFGRGRGIGQSLVDQALRMSKNHSFPRAGLIAVQNSKSFWQQFGFVSCVSQSLEMSQKLETYGEGAVYMELDFEAGV